MLKYIYNPKSISKKFRLNEAITANKVRLIDENEEQLGEVSLEEALQKATEADLDLVEVAPLAKPPVCKILDFGKYLYRQKKIDQKHKRMQKKTEMKVVRVSMRIDEHDLMVKSKAASKFLETGHNVKITMILKGREGAMGDLAKEKLDNFFERVKDVASMESAPKRQGNTYSMVLSPAK